MKSLFPRLVVLPLLMLVSSCGERQNAPTESAEGGKPVVHAVNYPLAYFAQRIGGDLVDLRYLPGEHDGDPAFWEPGESDIAAMQSADLILLNGATYAKWRDTVSLPESALVDTSKAFAGEYIATEDGVTHSHGADGEHSHGGVAFTTWMDLQQAIWQAEAVRDAFIDRLPDEKAALESRFEALATDLDQLHADFRALGTAIGSQPLVASHPVYQYFARRYQLEIKAVLWEPETVPDAAALEELKTLLAGHPAQWMIWEGEPAAESVSLLGELGVRSVVVDPCGNRPEAGDWLSVMRGNVENLRGLIAKPGE